MPTLRTLTKGFDEEALKRLQDDYLGSKTPDSLSALYHGLLSASQVLLKSRLDKLGKYYPANERDILAHDAVTRMLEMYLKRPNQGPMQIVSRLNLEIRFQLHNPKIIKQNYEGSLDGLAAAGPVKKPDELQYFSRVAEDPDVDGRHIIVDLYRYRYYKHAILAIAKYTKKSWIYSHCKELRNIWLMTRGKYGY